MLCSIKFVRLFVILVFDSWETVNQRFTKQDYARKFDLWSVACCPFITECRSFVSEFVVFFPAHMWKNRLVHLGRSGQRGVHLLILTSLFRYRSLSLPFPLVLYFQPCVLSYIIACIQVNPYRKSQLITRLYHEKLTRDGKV